MDSRIPGLYKLDPDERLSEVAKVAELPKDVQEKITAQGISAQQADAISENVTDDHGRRPLITSSRGRFSEGSIRETIYRVTQPCDYGDCPHDKDPKTCEYRRHSKRAGCPSSRSPHGIRRGSITNHLRTGSPQEVVSDRSSVSGDILDQHYDERTEREKMEIRREFIEGA